MTIGIVGRKSGMTRIFTEDGSSIPVTVVEVEPNRITQVKNVETDGYNAIQVAVGSRRASRVTKPQKGHFEKAQSEAAALVVDKSFVALGNPCLFSFSLSNFLKSLPIM